MLIGPSSGSGAERWPRFDPEQERTAEIAYGPVELLPGGVGGDSGLCVGHDGVSGARREHSTAAAALAERSADDLVRARIVRSVGR